MSKRKLRLTPANALIRQDFASVRFFPPEFYGEGPETAVSASYDRLQSYIDDLRLCSNADGRILLPHNTENALIRFLDMNTWLTCLIKTLEEARKWKALLARADIKRSEMKQLLGSLVDDEDDEGAFDKIDAENAVDTLEDLIYTAAVCAWEALCETKRRRLLKNWNYRVMSHVVTLSNASTLVGGEDDDPRITDNDLLELESVLQDHAWLFFMRTLWYTRLTSPWTLGTAVKNDFVRYCYEIGQTDLLVTDAEFGNYSMRDAVTAYSLFLRATYTYPYSIEMTNYEKTLATAMARLLAEPSATPEIDYDMDPFITNNSTSHLRKISNEPTSFGMKNSFIRFTDVLVFPTKLRLQTAGMCRMHCTGSHGELVYPSPKTERGYRYWRSIAYRLVQLNTVVENLENGFFRNDFCDFPLDHIYQSSIMENEILRFSLERPGQEPESSSILETLREKDYIELNALAKEMPHYFCANYTHRYLSWMRDSLGIEVSDFMRPESKDTSIPSFTHEVKVTSAIRSPPLETTCWPPTLPDISAVKAGGPRTFEREISEEEAMRVRNAIEFRPRTIFDNIAFFCYMYILNAWGRRASKKHWIYPDYVITDLMYRSDQIQEIIRNMEATNTANTPPYLIYETQQCYIFHNGTYFFCPHFSEAIELYISRFVSSGHVYHETTVDTVEDDHGSDDMMSVREPYILRNQSFLYHTDRQRKTESTFAIAPSLR